MTWETGGSRETGNELFIEHGWLPYRLRVFADRGGRGERETVIFNGIRRSFVPASQIAVQDPRIGVKLRSAIRPTKNRQLRKYVDAAAKIDGSRGAVRNQDTLLLHSKRTQ